MIAEDMHAQGSALGRIVSRVNNSQVDFDLGVC